MDKLKKLPTKKLIFFFQTISESYFKGYSHNPYQIYFLEHFIQTYVLDNYRKEKETIDNTVLEIISQFFQMESSSELSKDIYYALNDLGEKVDFKEIYAKLFREKNVDFVQTYYQNFITQPL